MPDSIIIAIPIPEQETCKFSKECLGFLICLREFDLSWKFTWLPQKPTPYPFRLFPLSSIWLNDPKFILRFPFLLYSFVISKFLFLSCTFSRLESCPNWWSCLPQSHASQFPDFWYRKRRLVLGLWKSTIKTIYISYHEFWNSNFNAKFWIMHCMESENSFSHS